jgi:SAM-dependent methyltransferase
MGEPGNVSVIRNPFDDAALAAGYEAWYETEGRVAVRLECDLLAWLLADFPGARSALEIGTGTGHFARWLSGRNWHLVGLDVAEPMLAEAVRRGGALFVRGEASELPFAAGAFDVALLITMLEFLPDPTCALREAARVARLGIVLGVLNRWSLLAGRRRRSGQPLWQAAHFYSPAELASQVRRALAARAGEVTWHTTLLPRYWPGRRSRLPLGAFIGLRVRLIGEAE